jgi:hypothetical protein
LVASGKTNYSNLYCVLNLTNYKDFIMIKKHQLINSLAVLIAAGLLNGCATSTTDPYAATQPILKIQDYFKGDIKAHGIVLNRQGKQVRSFTINMHGHWLANHGSLREDIRYNDGKRQTRLWQFTLQDSHHFTATAADAIGAAQGTQYGNTVHMTYTLNVPVDDSVYALNFDDLLYKLPSGKVINHTSLSKFGFNVSKVIITYHKK